jgi:hypothetical protein
MYYARHHSADCSTNQRFVSLGLAEGAGLAEDPSKDSILPINDSLWAQGVSCFNSICAMQSPTLTRAREGVALIRTFCLRPRLQRWAASL